MNDLARDVFVQATLNGTPQIKGRFTDGTGYCAMGLLLHKNPLLSAGVAFAKYDLFANNRSFHRECPGGCDTRVWMDEPNLIIHLNDEHSWTFLDFARKY